MTQAGPLDFERLYTEHFHEVARWARALGGLSADLDDLTQDVFIVVRRKLSTYRGPSERAFLYGITRKTVSTYRRRAFVRRLLRGELRSLDAGLDSNLESGALRASQSVAPHAQWEARQHAQRVLERMSALRRSALVLFEIEGYSGEEIAELEGVPVATIYTRLHHARRDFTRIAAELMTQSEVAP